MAECADESDGMDMQPGQYLTAPNKKYIIKKLLGKGGYGAVYKVVQEGTENVYALKAEKKLARRDHSKLNMEVFILKAMQNQPEEKSHYARIFDKCKKTQFYMIVMSLLGDSLSDIKKRYNPPVFSANTGYYASIQCLEAVEELHKIHFIHRDLKPGNYAVGIGQRATLIYILDFGIARRLLNEKNELKAPRCRVPFKGTVRFAPLATHENLELSYKDDCESWFYMVVDMMNPKGVPWKMEKEKDVVADLKRDCRKDPAIKERLFYGMAVEEFVAGFDYLTSLHYTDTVNYEFLYKMVRQAAQRAKVTMLPPYDWQKDGRSTDSEQTPMSDTSSYKGASSAALRARHRSAGTGGHRATGTGGRSKKQKHGKSSKSKSTKR